MQSAATEKQIEVWHFELGDTMLQVIDKAILSLLPAQNGLEEEDREWVEEISWLHSVLVPYFEQAEFERRVQVRLMFAQGEAPDLVKINTGCEAMVLEAFRRGVQDAIAGTESTALLTLPRVAALGTLLSCLANGSTEAVRAWSSVEEMQRQVPAVKLPLPLAGSLPLGGVFHIVWTEDMDDVDREVGIQNFADMLYIAGMDLEFDTDEEATRIYASPRGVEEGLTTHVFIFK